MGEYARLNEQIRRDEEQIAELKEALQQTSDEQEQENILETIYELQIGIGEIEGALFEMAEIDGLDDKYEALD